MVICLEQGADCLRMVWLMPVPSQNPVISCSFKSRMFLPFWFRLTKVVLEMRPLNGCSSSSAAVAGALAIAVVQCSTYVHAYVHAYPAGLPSTSSFFRRMYGMETV